MKQLSRIAVSCACRKVGEAAGDGIARMVCASVRARRNMCGV